MIRKQWSEKENEIQLATQNTGQLCKVIYDDWDSEVKNDLDYRQMIFVVFIAALAMIFAVHFKS